MIFIVIALIGTGLILASVTRAANGNFEDAYYVCLIGAAIALWGVSTYYEI
jgi:hypothetical protein